ncbi:MAG: hypothetical protein LH647_03990, partial [Leptolyngbyaceae cyanobacterium CAN_BIN12]|nr:hypothetical protein [Leptolyngbyaceae cyanobacterium CAN_BIN12]
MSAFTLFKRGNPCPVCDSSTGKCRERDELILCMNGTNEIAVPGYKFIGLTKDGTWGQWVVDNQREWTEQQRQHWQQERQAKQAQRLEAEKTRNAEAMPAGERDRHYRQLLSQLTLHSTDRADLMRRGVTDEQIKRYGVKSVERWQKLTCEFPCDLPGVGLDGRSLSNFYVGYLVPIQSAAGEITGFQIANRNRTGDEPKYPWLTSVNKNRPNGASPKLPCGELPLAVAFPANLDPSKLGQVGLCEGTGIKPRLAADRLGIPVIGASGGNFAASSQLLKEYLQQLGSKTVTLYPDAEVIQNPQTMRQYRMVWELLQE